MQIHVIKPKAQHNKKLRVCAYCRVSTEAEELENSLENQISHYKEEIERNPAYEFVEVYYDFAISGYKEKRPGFQRMLADAREHKFDLIITKSISRLARNTGTVLKVSRELKELGIGIFFELQNINTLSQAGELMMTVIAAFAQAESENGSALGKMAYRRKYEAGEPIHYLERSFGYTKDANGEFVPDPEQAPWVVKMYELCADGYNLPQIADFLNEKGVPTTAGATFTCSTVLRILENEIYKGDYIMHKHFVDEFRRERRNRGEEDSWYIEEDHEPIVSKKLWQKAQDALARKRAYLAQGSVVEELTEENYPYMNQIFCAECGYPLMRRIYSNGNRVNWGCSGMKRYNKKFCSGINVPDSVIREWGELPGNIYIRKEMDALGKATLKYVRESTWKKNHKRKDGSIGTRVPELNEENYPYYKRIYCGKCGGRLVRLVSPNNSILWICNTTKRKGKHICPGVRVPDSVIRSWGNFNTEICIDYEMKNSGKTFFYTERQVD